LLGISESQFETSAAGTAHFEAGGVFFWDCQQTKHSLVEIRLKAEARARIRWVRRSKDVGLRARLILADGL
jgi:hypothetical protein